MNFVQPIKDKSKIQSMKKYLKGQTFRDHLLFTLGINSGLRVSDLLQLSVCDVKGRDRITIREKKTGKTKDFPLSEVCKKTIFEYLKDTGISEGTLFPSRKGDKKPISSVQAWRILSDAAKTVGIKESIGTHSMRKSFAYHAFQSGVDITRIQKLLNHSSPGITLEYIGITKQELDDVYINLNL